MYVSDDLNTFKNAETRLKQIMLKLKEQELANKELKSQIIQQKQKVVIEKTQFEKKKAQEINGNLQNMLVEINGLVNENMKLKESQGVPVSTTVQA